MSLKSTKTSGSTKAPTSVNFAFQKVNYQIFVASIILVIIGFSLMAGTENIYSFTKITLAPFVVLSGFALGFVAILYKPKNKNIQN